ncbi:MAG: hypothetical protein WAQ52_03720 [Terriglobales bacterium]
MRRSRRPSSSRRLAAFPESGAAQLNASKGVLHRLFVRVVAVLANGLFSEFDVLQLLVAI